LWRPPFLYQLVQRSGQDSGQEWDGKICESVLYVDAEVQYLPGFLNELDFLLIRGLMVQVHQGAFVKPRLGNELGLLHARRGRGETVKSRSSAHAWSSIVRLSLLRVLPAGRLASIRRWIL
jgi:hypothetical protein